MAEHPRNREDDTTPSAPDELFCPVCWAPFIRTGRQRYCSDTCRKTAWTRRQATGSHLSTKPVAAQAIQPPDVTIYACPSCQARYHGEQWCQRCNQPCTRLGLGGRCPHCEAPVAVTDLLDTHTRSTANLSTPAGGEFR